VTNRASGCHVRRVDVQVAPAMSIASPQKQRERPSVGIPQPQSYIDKQLANGKYWRSQQDSNLQPAE
jgi:hypothetical protein